ncbi:MAG: DegT/DnrJ/EryC1/StrS family aminotransferase, partial [Candidatus Omnitrophica bacterium]|nr:DegT/DnrJ/EryC1/StrS family aminotransferase [Candidatus Omnitrophota bacterium]
GKGGLLATDREDLYQRALVLRDHGRRPGDPMFYNAEVAYKYKMSSMQAALGLAQLERLEELIERKRRIFAWYKKELAGVKGVTLNYEAPGTRNTYWMNTVVLSEDYRLDKIQLMRLLSEHNIDSRPFFYPLSSLPAYRDLPQAEAARRRNAVSYRLSPRAINLPSSLLLTEEKVSCVCRVLKQILGVAA